jgi:surface antigen
VLIRRLTLPATLVAVLAMLLGLLITAPSAEASSTILCKGFAGCKQAGYKRFGYTSRYTTSWWRMYAGHNCTNYVSYRMIRNGMSATRPWSGSGDARNWGTVFASKTNQTPVVGSVAWWSTNHVAYVQQVVDANTIVISEDHWGGDFDWRKIVRTGGGWPTGFIHLTDETLKAKAAPKINGSPKVDVPVSAATGTWKPTGSVYTYQWYADGVAIAGATGSSYKPTAQQVAMTLTVKVTAGRYGYVSGASMSAPTAPVAPGTMRTTAVPTVTGLAKVGGVLTVAGGSWLPAPTSRSIQWYADGVAIPGATQVTLKLGAAQLGKRITAVVAAQRAGYVTAKASSLPTAPVAPEKMSVTREPVVTGAPHLGHAISVTPGAVSPAGATTTYRWLRDGRPIRHARAATYTPQPDDLGTHLSVRVKYTMPGYTPVVRVLALAPQVRAYPHIKVRSQTHRAVTVSVVVDGLKAVGGTVTVYNGRGIRRTQKLVHGRATFSPDWLTSGKRTFTVIYSGSFRVDGKTVTRTVVVR